MKTAIVGTLAALFLCSCAASSGVVPMGQGNFMVSKQAATGFPGLGTLKAEVIQEASTYCAGQGKALKVNSTEESRPPFVLGNYPRSEVQFSCVDG